MANLKGIAILGAGLFVNQAYLPALAILGSTAPPLKAVYSRSQKSSSAIAKDAAKLLGLPSAPDAYFDGNDDNLDSLLQRSDISAVIIALPITLQPEFVLKCLSAGKHVLSEKPVAPDVARGLSLLSSADPLCQTKGLVWRVAENFEAEPAYRAAGEAIRSGKIGKVQFFKATVVNYVDKTSEWYKTPWRTVPDYQGGFLLDGGVHTIAALRTMLTEPFTQLSGFASLNKDYLLPHDTIHCIVRAGSHYHGVVEMTFASPTKSIPAAENIVITGSDGWVACNMSSEGFTVVIKSRVKEDGKPEEEQEYKETEETMTFPSKGVEVELAAFFAEIQKDGTGEQSLDIGNPRNALKDVGFIQAALNSEGNLTDLVLHFVPPE